MLVAGSLGMVASTLPVQWLLPVLGGAACSGRSRRCWPWRCWQSGCWCRPMRHRRWRAPVNPAACGDLAAPVQAFAPLAFFHHGGMLAADLMGRPLAGAGCAAGRPTRRSRAVRHQRVDAGLAYGRLGLVVPRLYRHGWPAQPTSCAGACRSASACSWLACCWASVRRRRCGAVLRELLSGVAHRPAVGRPYPRQAGRALSAYNLLIFTASSLLQWGSAR